MIQIFPGSSGLLLTVLLATLPALLGIQGLAALIGAAKRRRRTATPEAVRALVKALNLHPLTVSFTIDVTAQDFPVLTVVRHLSNGELKSIADWAQTMQQVELRPKSP